ncbi:MAG: CYTH domain-containing protein [Eubacteriales bacterium]|jgi:inorganic triphosphatase YgiF
MELEYKYAVPDDPTADAIVRDAQVWGTPEVIEMSTYYYDTPDHALREKYLTLRLREERIRGGKTRTMCCLKAPYGEESDPALKRHVELEREAPDIGTGVSALLTYPDAAPYAADLIAARECGLIIIASLAYTRWEYRLTFGGAVCTLCVDRGTIGHEMLRELELELKDGAFEPVTKLAGMLAEKYRLTPEPRSKYARALLGG